MFSKKWLITCRDATGLKFSVVIRASSPKKIEEYCHLNSYTLDSVRPARRTSISKVFQNIYYSFTYRVSTKQMVSFYKSFASMYQNSLPVMDILTICASAAESKGLQRVINTMKLSLSRGNDLSSAMIEHPNVFDRLTCTRIQAANRGGYLDKAMLALADDAEQTHDINRKVSGAFIYPSVVIFFGLVVIMIFGTFVIPKFAPLYQGRSLPFVTEVILTISVMIKKFPILAFLIPASYLYLFYRKADIAKTTWCQQLFFILPGIKGLMRAINLAKFMRMMAQLQQAAIPLPTQLKLIRESSNVRQYREAWTNVLREVERGNKLTTAMGKHITLFSPFLVGNLQAGEAAGKIEDSAIQIARFYEEEVKDTIKNINVIIEPMLIIVIGILVGALLIGMFMPIFDMAAF